MEAKLRLITMFIDVMNEDLMIVLVEKIEEFMDITAGRLCDNFALNNGNPALIRVLAFRMTQKIECRVPRLKSRLRSL